MRKKEFLALVENARVNDPAYAEYERNVRRALANTRLVRVEPAPAGSFVPGIPVAAGRRAAWKNAILNNAQNVAFPNQRLGDANEALRGIEFLVLNQNDSFYTYEFFEGYTGIQRDDEWGYRFMHFWPNTFFECWSIADRFRDKKLYPIFKKWLSIWMEYLGAKMSAKGGPAIKYARPRKYDFNCAPIPYLFTYLPEKIGRRAIDDYRKMDCDLANTIDRLTKNNLIVFPSTELNTPCRN